MDWEAVLKLITAALASVGAGGAIVFGLSSWIGKVWANRILANEKHKLGTELEKTKRELDIIKETTLRFQNDKIITYRSILDVVARILALLDANRMGRLQGQEAGARFDEFNEQRIRVYGYLAMIAPQEVMDANDKLMDYILEITHGTIEYNWNEVRELAIKLLNQIRVDIGIDKNPIEYRGRL